MERLTTYVHDFPVRNNNAASFTEALKAAYPNLPGDTDALAQALYSE